MSSEETNLIKIIIIQSKLNNNLLLLINDLIHLINFDKSEFVRTNVFIKN